MMVWTASARFFFSHCKIYAYDNIHSSEAILHIISYHIYIIIDQKSSLKKSPVHFLGNSACPLEGILASEQDKESLGQSYSATPPWAWRPSLHWKHGALPGDRGAAKPKWCKLLQACIHHETEKLFSSFTTFTEQSGRTATMLKWKPAHLNTADLSITVGSILFASFPTVMNCLLHIVAFLSVQRDVEGKFMATAQNNTIIGALGIKVLF